VAEQRAIGDFGGNLVEGSVPLVFVLTSIAWREAWIDWSGSLKLSARVKSPTVSRRQARKPGLEESQHESVIEETRRYESASTERRDDQPGMRNPNPMGSVIAGLPITVGSGTVGATASFSSLKRDTFSLVRHPQFAADTAIPVMSAPAASFVQSGSSH
jgi:hypothetical protein